MAFGNGGERSEPVPCHLLSCSSVQHTIRPTPCPGV